MQLQLLRLQPWLPLVVGVEGVVVIEEKGVVVEGVMVSCGVLIVEKKTILKISVMTYMVGLIRQQMSLHLKRLNLDFLGKNIRSACC